MRLASKALLGIVLSITALAGCSSPPTPTPEPRSVYIGVIPAYAEVTYSWLAGFAEQDPLHELTLLVVPSAAGLEEVKARQQDFLITSIAPPSGWFATPLLLEPLVIAVSADVPLRNLKLDDLSDIYAGRIRDWSELDSAPGEITPIIFPSGDEIRQAFERELIGSSRITSNALLAPDPAALVEMLMAESGAIGVLPASALPANLKTISIDGAAPTQANAASARYPLTIELLALSIEEPTGLARSWLGWLQSQQLTAYP